MAQSSQQVGNAHSTLAPRRPTCRRPCHCSRARPYLTALANLQLAAIEAAEAVVPLVGLAGEAPYTRVEAAACTSALARSRLVREVSSRSYSAAVDIGHRTATGRSLAVAGKTAHGSLVQVYLTTACQLELAVADRGIAASAKSTAAEAVVARTELAHACGLVAGLGKVVPRVALVARQETRCR